MISWRNSGTTWPKSLNTSPSEEEYQGVNITALGDQVAFARSERLVIFGANAASVQAAIDAQKTGSLSGQPAYKDLAKQLPGDRALTVYVNGSQFQDALKELAGSSFGNLSGSISFGSWREAVVSLSIVDAGVQLDTVYAYDTASMSEEQKALLESSGADPRTDDLFPEGTLFFLKGQRLDLVWKAYRQVLGESLGSTDFDEAMNMFAQQYGFNPDSDLFPYLNGEWALGLMPSSEGLLAKSANVNLGFAFLAETNNPAALRTTMDSLHPRLEEQGAVINETESGGIKFTQLEDQSSVGTLAAYCVSDRYLALGSSSKSLEKCSRAASPSRRAAAITRCGRPSRAACHLSSISTWKEPWASWARPWGQRTKPVVTWPRSNSSPWPAARCGAAWARAP